MKLKENKDLSFYGRLLLIFFLCCSVTVVIRTAQVFLFIDRETGFSKGGSILSALLYIVLTAASVFFASTSFLSRESAKLQLKSDKNKLLSVLGCILAAAFLYDSLSSFAGTYDSLNGPSYGVSLFQSMMLSGTIPQFFQSGFALLSAVYFIIFAKDAIKGTENYSKHRILAVAPVCWAGFRLIYRFVEQISYVRVSELLLELVMLAFTVLFFMAFAQVASGVYVKNARWRIVGIGLPSALLSLTLNIPRLIFALTKGADALYAKYPFKVCDFILALFIVVLVMKITSDKKEIAEGC